MLLNKLSVIIVHMIAIKTSIATSVCDIEGGSCNYKVTCRFHPGTASNTICNNEPNVTFVITSSTAMTVTTTFFGATNFDSRVRYIEAINNTWNTLGSLAFRYYSKVKHINLSGNFISEIQEETFKTLVPLTYLNLSNNLITELYPKSLLITESKSTDMEILDLSNNRISALAEEVLSYLPYLTHLYLQGNKLKTLADNCFDSQKYLIMLHLEHNFIERLNMSLINMKRVTYLDLSFNEIKTLSGYETNRLSNLEHFNISNNKLQTFERTCFVQSTNLQVVDMSYNLIDIKIESIMFAGNIKLKYLDFFNNHIIGIEENSFKHTKLTYLNLTNNNLSGELKLNTFGGLENITKMDLSRQNISTIKNNAFLDMKTLLHLNLSKNSISDIDNGAFYNSSLNILDISYNNITSLIFLNNTLKNLTELYLNDNNITILHKNTFQHQVFLLKLDLTKNKIKMIEENSLPLQSLQYFNINNNNLIGILKNNMLSPSKYLRSLDLSNFNFSQIDDMAFVNMPALARLNLSHNTIEKIMPSNFENMNNMYSLDLSSNNLSDFQFNNSLLTNLKAAYLNNNKLNNISTVFPSPCKLIYLDMSKNGISDVSYLNSKLFPELQTLHLSQNNIKTFNNFRTNTLFKLLDLSLSSNKIKYINLSYYKELMIVDLSNNYLEAINNTFFKNVDHVQSVDLSRNNISDLPPGTFLNMRNLKLLNLSSNYITKLRYGSLKGLQKTELLDISNNRIESLDIHVFHECTELKTLIIDYNRIKTFEIDKLVRMTQWKLKTVSLGGNPISCHEIIQNSTLRYPSFYGIYQVEVTSIHKIYHEDNVKGIKCGEDEATTTVTIEKVPFVDGSSSSTTIIVLCCIILVIVLATVSVLAYIKLKKKYYEQVSYRNSRVHLRTSAELGGSDYDIIH